jgi:hypothetical protein
VLLGSYLGTTRATPKEAVAPQPTR